MRKIDYDSMTEEERDALFWKDEQRSQKFEFKLRIFNWALEITAFPRVVLWKYDGSSGYAPIQWSWRGGFRRMKAPQRLSIECVGVRIVSAAELQDDSILEADVVQD